MNFHEIFTTGNLEARNAGLEFALIWNGIIEFVFTYFNVCLAAKFTNYGPHIAMEAARGNRSMG